MTTQTHKDTTEMEHTYFLVLDDNSNNPATGPFCGSHCTMHKFTVRANESQTVHLSAHSWPLRTYPTDCLLTNGYKSGANEARHYVRFVGKDSNINYTGQGSWRAFTDHTGFDAIQMSAGAELEVTMEMEWKPKMSKDFSIVAWSTGSLDIIADTLHT